MGNKFNNECLDCLKTTLKKEIKKLVAPWALNFDSETIPLDKLPDMSNIILIIDNTWHINGIDTGISALGIEGKSAYEEAVSQGFQGTELDWLISLKGEKGDPGERGLQGIQGIQGPAGPQGELGERGILGPQGEQGPQGETGPQGPQGLRGLQGEKGETGASGTNGLRGDTPQIVGGYWYIGGTNTGVKSTGENGLNGTNGRDGANGTNGSNGTSSYLHIAYANITGNSISNFSTTDSTDRAYLGTCVTNDNSIPTPGLYVWTLIKGADGQNGRDGDQGPQGNPSYIHIKYSNDNGLTFTANNGETEGIYMGLCVTSLAQDPDDPSLYKWARIRGIDGDNGMSINIKGNLANATALVGLDPAELDTGDSYVLDSDGHLYTWTGLSWHDNGQFKGTDGVSEYIHIAWANSANGVTDFATSQQSGTEYSYIGIRRDNNSADSQNPADYTWSRIKGDLGEQGLDGRSAYLVYLSTVPLGTTPMTEEEWLQSLQGEVDPETLEKVNTLDRDALRQNTILGTLPASGATTSNTLGFKVNEYGQLIASNAIIYGTIYANNGIFNGEILANSGSVGGWYIENNRIYSLTDLDSTINPWISTVELNSSHPSIEVRKAKQGIGGGLRLDFQGISIYLSSNMEGAIATPANASLRHLLHHLDVDGSGFLGDGSIMWDVSGKELTITSEYEISNKTLVLTYGNIGSTKVGISLSGESHESSIYIIPSTEKLAITGDVAIYLNSPAVEITGQLYFGDSGNSREYIDVTTGDYLTLHSYNGVMVEGDFIVDDFTHKYKLDVSAAVTAGILTQIA